MDSVAVAMRERILELEQVSQLLEPDRATRIGTREQVMGYADEFLDAIEHLNAYNITDDKGSALLVSPIGDDPIHIDEALELIRQNVDRPGLNPASGGHLGYIPGGGIYYSALGDYLADISNRYAGVFFAGPGAVRMENMLIKWMAGVVGYPSTAGGNLASGGSIANLIAIVTAREAKRIGSRDIPISVIYYTEQVHHSVTKAIRIAGLSECRVRLVPTDASYRMDTLALEQQISADKTDGYHPFLVIASAGTTDVGAIDPLADIAQIAQRHGMWYHIDAAYGGFFALTDEGRTKLRGMDLSDSVTVDPHKGLFLPYGLGIVLVRDKESLRHAHDYAASYMQDALSSIEEDSPAELSPELTKHFRGMRMWLPLKLLGVKPFRACLDEKLHLARYFYHEIQKLGFEVGREPELSVVTYRYVPSEGDANEFNKKILDAVMNDGRIFISSTVLHGNYTLRFAALSFRTHLRTVDLLLEILAKAVTDLQS